MGHIVKSYDLDLEGVLAELTAMGRLVRKQLTDTAVALARLDEEEGARIMRRDAEVNGYEVTVDALIEQVFARRQPAAGDLRRLIGMGRISVDFERMGDEIRAMASSIGRLGGLDESLLESRAALIMAVETVAHMIDDAIVAVARGDAELARNVIERDRSIDEVYRTTLRSLILHMMRDPATVEGALALTWIGRSLERTGDHVKNIGEAVIYMVEGADVRHEFYTVHETSTAADSRSLNDGDAR